MLKPDTRPWMQTLGLLAGISLVLGLGSWLYKGTSPWLTLIGSGLFCLMLWVFGGRRQWKELRRAEQRRQSAITAPQWVPLAWYQPAPDPAAPPLPFVIASKPGWLSFLIAPLVVWVAVLFLLAIWFWGFKGSFVPTLLFSVEVTLPLSIVGCLREFEWIEVREEGLTIRTLFRRQSIPWREARLFAIDATLKPTATPNRYELSSATTILRWSRDLTPSRGTRLSSPFEEYSRQMDALLALIAGRTGLPLHNLRGWLLPPLPLPQYPSALLPDHLPPNVPDA